MIRAVLVWPVSPEEPTAAAARLLGLLSGAKAAGIDPVVLFPRHLAKSNGTNGGVSKGIPLYDSHVEAGGPIWGMLCFPTSTARLARELRHLRCQCLIASTPGPIIPFQAAIAAKILGVPYILDIRDSWQIEKVTHRGALRNWFKNWLEGFSAHSAIRVLAVTKSLLESVRARHRLGPASLRFVPNGANLHVFRPLPVPKTTDLVFVGSPARYRTPQAVLDALVALRNLRPTLSARFLGWASSPERVELEQTVERLHLSSCLRLEPAIRHAQVPEFISTARMGVVSLSSENALRMAIGAKAYEYVACGVPLACLGPAGTSELRSFVDMNEVGFYATGPTEFAQLANGLLSEPNRLNRLSDNCIRMSSQIDWRRIAEKLWREVSPIATKR